MPEHDRHFGRALITWKITEVTRGFLQNPKLSPSFSVFLGERETQWRMAICGNDNGVVLSILPTEKKKDFSLNFSLDDTQQEVIRRRYEEKADGLTSIPIPNEDLFDVNNKFLIGNDLSLEMKLELIEDEKIKMLESNYLLDNYEKNLNNERRSDFVFICSDNGKVYVQKAFIAAQCEAFEAMVGIRMTETTTNSATITDVDSETMLELVRFLYCGRVNKMKEVQERLVIAANKYGLERLQNICVSSLMESLTVQNVSGIFEIAYLLGEEHLKANCIDFIKFHQSRFEYNDFSEELSLAVFNSDKEPIRVRIENDKLI